MTVTHDGPNLNIHDGDRKRERENNAAFLWH